MCYLSLLRKNTTGQVRTSSGQVRKGQFRSGQVKTGKDRLGKVKKGRDMPGNV